MSADPAQPEAAASMSSLDFAGLAGATPTQLDDLSQLLVMLMDWNGRMNLVGASTLPDFWSRHAWDSAQLLALAPGARRWADLGAGAGFPGLVLAVLLKGQVGAEIHLVESMAKRCRFLSEVVDALSLPAVVQNARAESLKLSVDIVTARACAPLPRLLGYAKPYLDRGGTGLFLKSADVGVEIEEARKTWAFKADILPSRSDLRGRVLRIERLARAAKS